MAVFPKGLPLMAEWNIDPAKDRALGWGLGAIPQGAAPAQPFREDIPALMISSTRRMLLAITVLETGKKSCYNCQILVHFGVQRHHPVRGIPSFTSLGHTQNSASLTMNEAAAF